MPEQGSLFDGLVLTDTLATARAELRAQLDDGAECPCCGQFAKRYRRKLNSNMVRFLIGLYCAWRSTGESWVHYADLPFKGRDYPYLQHWGLAWDRSEREEDSGARTSGYWQPSGKGVRFVLGLAQVERYALIYNNEVTAFEGPRITVWEALGDRFDYQELMAGGGGDE